MSSPDQCPSTKKNGIATQSDRTPRDVSAATGKAFWRSLDDLAGTTEFRDFLQREFPAQASELLDGSRRHFLRIMGASLALAGAATIPGCRRPDHKILAYHQDPERIVQGKPLYYATAMSRPNGGCEGLLVETFEGRPTKIEGNPLHPGSAGKSTTWSQAHVLGLYDPDRNPEIYAQKLGITPADWKQFTDGADAEFAPFDEVQGDGLAFLVDKSWSPAREILKQRIQSRWPGARWYVYEPLDREAESIATRIVFAGTQQSPPYHAIPQFDKAKVVLSIDSDFLGGEDITLTGLREFGANRIRPGAEDGHEASGTEMSRLYVVESALSLTGTAADHRFVAKPSQIENFALHLAQSVFDRSSRGNKAMQLDLLQDLPALEGHSESATLTAREWLEAVVDDLFEHRGECVIVAGPNQPPIVHALLAAMNETLGGHGRTVRYFKLEGDEARAGVTAIADLVGAMDAGSVEKLVVVGGNPVYDAPADLNFGEIFRRLSDQDRTIYLGEPNETAQAASRFFQQSHPLETWSDLVDWDGVYSVQQPMIAPLYETHSDLEFLAYVSGASITDPYELVQLTMRGRLGIVDKQTFNTLWKRALHDGYAATSVGSSPQPKVNWVKVTDIIKASRSIERPDDRGIEVLFTPCPKIWDGRFANNGWLQELPHQITKISWDNPALISRRTAERLGLSLDRHPKTPQYNHGQMVKVSLDGRSIEVPVWIQPGMADDCIVLTLGYGREVCGRIGQGTGVNVYPLRTSGAMRAASGAEIEPARGRSPYLLANTQDHWAMEGRAILRELDLPAWQAHGDTVYASKDHYDRSRKLNVAALLGTESHTPANESIYKLRRTRQQQEQLHIYYKADEHGEPILDANGNVQARENKWGHRTQQWGMSIDLTKCIGCGACTVACQAENNIPIVGKIEVAKGREMHWIRVDRYYASEKMDESAFDHPDIGVQPVACVHCELAPCEVVCPVNATVHGGSGTNDMAYNRCIGTRYCSNNCPYKVRRFNYFDYGTKQFNGSFGQLAEGLTDELLPQNENWIPPRLREPIKEVATMQYNPHVTVRSRGVMEKCTYCMQRINQASAETKVAGLELIPDGFFQAACQQACPTDAIVFGDIYDNDANRGKGSLVKQARNSMRSYALLAYINTRPRTTYQLRLRNPNPAIREPNVDPHAITHALEEMHGHHGGDHGNDHSTSSHDDGHVMSLPILQVTGASA